MPERRNARGTIPKPGYEKKKRWGDEWGLLLWPVLSQRIMIIALLLAGAYE